MWYGQQELLTLLSVDDLQVSRSVSNSTGVTYLVTFTGALVRGDVPNIEMIDLGTNGCNTGAPAGVFGAVTISGSTHGAQTSFVPVYRQQTTAPLPVTAPAAWVKDALESLSLVARVDVDRQVAGNGYQWLVTFRGDPQEKFYPLNVNGANVQAAVDGAVAVTPVVDYEVTGLTTGVNYYVSVAAQNAYGTSAFTAALPASKQPIAQPPAPPRQVRATMKQNHFLDLQFNVPDSEHTLGNAKNTFKAYGALHV